jgi:hypothetical protein
VVKDILSLNSNTSKIEIVLGEVTDEGDVNHFMPGGRLRKRALCK